MRADPLHRFEQNGSRFAIDPETCFCFECDDISWDVLEHYPYTPVNRIYHLLGDKYDVKELEEVIGELEWLRATDAILKKPGRDEQAKQLQVDRGLERLSVRLPRRDTETVQKRTGWFGGQATVISTSAREQGREAVSLLLTRSGQKKDLCLEFVEPGAVRNPDLMTDLCTYALKHARLAGKNLTATVCVTDIAISNPPEALAGHTISAKLEFQDPTAIADRVKALARDTHALNRLAKALQGESRSCCGRIVVQPGHAKFGGVVAALDKAGFATIEIDLDGAFAANPDLDPASMLPGLSQTAVYYAEQLLKHKYFRLDPIASLFYRIYDGKPLHRSDPAGTSELAIDDDGGIYPSSRLVGHPDLCLGSITDGNIDEDALGPFDDLGSMTTGACRNCWARSLCGGGSAAVHQALSGSYRKPHEPWCDMQRAWMAAAVSAFNLLSSQGVNFTRVYNALSRSFKPSLFTLVRAAFRVSIGMRPIEEADAEMLCEWENWSEAAYFLCNETGLLLATRYDRQMDALHPKGTELEMILLRKNGDPLGLVKLRPERMPGTAKGWVFLHDEADYDRDEVRKGFRTILKEAGGRQSIRRVTVPVSEPEAGLQAFLEAVGFAREGTMREALFIHGGYRDVHLYGICLEDLKG